VRKSKFKEHPGVIPELDLVEEEDQITHNVSLMEEIDPEDKLNIF
jgi:pre-mRNA-splicing factor CWC22